MFSWPSGAKVSWSLRAPAERDDDNLALLANGFCAHKWACADERGSPSAMPGVPRRNSRRLRLKPEAISRGLNRTGRESGASVS